MKLWILARLGFVGYDEADGIVVAAESATDARMLASEHCGDEGKSVWLDEKSASCLVLAPGKTPRVIIVDFNAG